MRLIGKAIGWFFSGFMLGFIAIYRHTFSAFVGRSCRHLPTCSEYARDAIKTHGAWVGFWMGISRVIRCSPWGTDGYDPVPTEVPSNARWYLPWRYNVKPDTDKTCC